MQETVGDNIFLLIILCTGGISLLVISFVILFINNQKKLLRNRQQLHESEMSYQKELMRVVLQSQEEERKRIGQDLHDDVGGSLSNLRMVINRNELYNEQAGGSAAERHKLLIDKIIQDVRNISHHLSPPALALFGFTVALEELIDSINDEDNSLITLINDAEAITDKLSYDMALTLIRVLQELISNTVKHGGAKRIEISIFMEKGLLAIQYRDEGLGYDPGDQKNRKGMGMQNIESRLNMINATYTVKTAPGSGFSMFIVLNSSLV
jgi:signal transduction histidine kinase